MKKIGVDLDEILSDTLSPVLEYYNKIHHTSFKRDKFTTHNYWETWGGTKEKAMKLIDEYYQTDYFKNTKPLPGAFEALLKIKEFGYKLCVITGRSIGYEKQTKAWIDKYYPNIFSDIFFVNTFGKTDEISRNKSEICNSLGIKIFIEDDPYYIEDCANAGIKVLYLDYPWNKEVNFKNSTRVYSWKEIAEKLNEEINFKRLL